MTSQTFREATQNARASESGVAKEKMGEPEQSFACFLINRQEHLMHYFLTLDSQGICIVSRDTNNVKATLGLDLCHVKKAPLFQMH